MIRYFCMLNATIQREPVTEIRDVSQLLQLELLILAAVQSVLNNEVIDRWKNVIAIWEMS